MPDENGYLDNLIEKMFSSNITVMRSSDLKQKLSERFAKELTCEAFSSGSALDRFSKYAIGKPEIIVAFSNIAANVILWSLRKKRSMAPGAYLIDLFALSLTEAALPAEDFNLAHAELSKDSSDASEFFRFAVQRGPSALRNFVTGLKIKKEID